MVGTPDLAVLEFLKRGNSAEWQEYHYEEMSRRSILDRVFA